MSTPIYKVSDGSTITFIKTGPRVQAKLTIPDGQAYIGDFLSSSTPDVYNKLAKEIQLAHNIVDSNGAPLPYTTDNDSTPNDSNSSKNINDLDDPTSSPPPGVIDNSRFNIPRITLAETPDVVNLTTLQTNSDINQKESEQLKKTLSPQLSVQDRLANTINDKKEEIKRTLIPFVLSLLAAFGTSAVQALASKNPITPDQLKQLINCPTASKISDIIRKRNSIVKQLNNIYKIINILTKTLGITNIVISALTVGIQLAKAIPYPATGVPPLGLPPVTVGLQNTASDALQKLQNLLRAANVTISILTLTVGSFGIFLGKMIELLNSLDTMLQQCAEDQNMDLETINDEINALANSMITQSQTPEGNIYKGFKLEIVINEKNTSKYIQRYAQALTSQRVPVLKTEPSFASDPNVLIDQLKFIIDSNPNLTAE